MVINTSRIDHLNFNRHANGANLTLGGSTVTTNAVTGKTEIDVTQLPIDLMSLASHKTYGPKGIGALYVRRKPRVRLEAQMHGGGHERGMRSGTLPTHQIVGMGEAFRLAKLEMAQDNAKAHALQKRLLDGLKKANTEQFVFSSTLLVHAPSPERGVPINEDSPLDPAVPW